jgi:hypothetical protein
MPQIPMFFDKLSVAHSDRVTNVEFDTQERLNYVAVEVVE